MDTDGYLERASRRLDRFLSKYGGKSWRGCAHFFFWNLGQCFRIPHRPRATGDAVCRIVFLLRGGMGDQMIALNYIQNFERALDCPHEISIGVSHARDLGMVRALCHAQPFVHRVLGSAGSLRSADLVAEMVRFPRILYRGGGKACALGETALRVVDALEGFQAKNPFLFRYSTPADALGIDYSRLMGRNRLQQGDIGGILGVESLYRPVSRADEEGTLKKHGLTGRRFATIQRGSGGRNGNISTKLWPPERFGAVAWMLRERFPDLLLVQVGKTSNDPIPGVGLDLRGKTDLGEIMVLLKRSACHIDGEGGLVHLRHFLGGGPSVVVFGATSARFYGYPENTNLQADFCPDGCEWMTGDYEIHCPRGCEGCENSRRIQPEEVFRSAEKLLS